jgi:hypothetical protein
MSTKLDLIKKIDERLQIKKSRRSDYTLLIENTEDASERIIESMQIILHTIETKGSTLLERKNELLSQLPEQLK